MAEAVKQLKIKTGSVGRLSKELLLYQEEELQEQKKVSQLKAGGADQHDIKHAENVLAEANMMIPDTRQRLAAALQDLSNLLNQAEPAVLSSEEYCAAKEMCSTAKRALNEDENEASLG